MKRRDFLKAGGRGLTGVTLAGLLEHEAHAGPAAKTENSVIRHVNAQPTPQNRTSTCTIPCSNNVVTADKYKIVNT